MSKIQIDATGIKHLAEAARRNGTQDRFLDLVVEWCDGAEEIALGYKARIEELDKTIQAQHDNALSRIAEAKTAQARIELLESVAKAGLRMRNTPVVDDDFPEMMHNFDGALRQWEKSVKDEMEDAGE